MEVSSQYFMEDEPFMSGPPTPTYVCLKQCVFFFATGGKEGERIEASQVADPDREGLPGGGPSGQRQRRSLLRRGGETNR